MPDISCKTINSRVSISSNQNQGSLILQGKKRVEKPNNLPRLVSPSSLSDSSSSSCVGTSKGNLSVSSLPPGTTMKKLLADEMKKESESGRRPPSIIANLMGLDWLPAQQNASKQNKRISDDYQKKCNSGNFVKGGKSGEIRSQKKHGKGQQKCGDVYEVTERSNMETGSITSRGASFRNGSDADVVAFVRQKFIDVKRFSTDEKLRHSKEFHDALEVLDSNKDLLLKFLQEPNSLFTKHLHHLHGAREAQCGCVEGMKSSKTLKSNVDVIGYHSRGESCEKIDISHPCNEGHADSYRRHTVGPRKLKVSSKGKEDALSIATRIVVLKPNLGKVRNTARSFSSTTPPRDPVSDNEFHNVYSNKLDVESEMTGTRSKHDDLDFCSVKSRESREIAKKVTRKMKNRLGVDSFNVSSYGYKGYSADESSSDVSENDSSYESEVTILGPATASNRELHNKASSTPSPSSSSHMESSISREAKRRLSKRWQMTQKSHDTEASGKGSTLAEMLAIPDVELRPQNVDYVAAQDERPHKFGRDGETTGSTNPCGISSRDGWKDGNAWNPSRFRSLSASPSQHGSPKSSTRHETITPERFLVRARSQDSGKSKSSKRDSERKHGFFPESRRSKSMEYQSTCMEITDDVDIQSSLNTVTSIIDGKASPDVKSVIVETVSGKHVPLSAVIDTEHKCVGKSLNCLEIVSAPTAKSTHDDRFNYDVPSEQQELSSSYDVEHSSCLQFSTNQAKSLASSKESEQPSPVSVLETPFVEEVSSGSECFERVSVELHGLRMQLQLLKQESEVYDEGCMLVSSDECEESTEIDNGKGLDRANENWEPSYLVDVLTYSGLDEVDHEMSLETWHSPSCPIGPWVFDNLEKKYCKWESCLRSERKLLFDLINAAIIEIFCQYVDVGHRLMPYRNASRQWWKNGLKTELSYLLESHEKEEIENGLVAARHGDMKWLDGAILRDMKWFKLRDHLDGVGSDIEGGLIDELAAEFLSL